MNGSGGARAFAPLYRANDLEDRNATHAPPALSLRQQTLRSAFTFRGVGLHSGAITRVTLEPLPPNSGRQLVRTDISHAKPFIITPSHIVDTQLSTTLEHQNQRIATVEHLMASLLGCQVDNVLIRVDGPEIPLLDGSALELVEGIDSVGTVAQDAPVRWLELTDPIHIIETNRWVILSPPAQKMDNSFGLTCTLRFPHLRLLHQSLRVTLEDFRTAIAPARTFGFERDMQALFAAGLIRGGSLDTALVMGEENWLNPERLRFSDEPVRHKLLDALGDLALLNCRLRGTYQAEAPGHALHARLTRCLALPPLDYCPV